MWPYWGHAHSDSIHLENRPDTIGDAGLRMWRIVYGIPTRYAGQRAKGSLWATETKDSGRTIPYMHAQLMLILYRYARYKELDTSVTQDLSAFPNAGSIPSWGLEAMKWAVASGLDTGDSGKHLFPGSWVERTEIAVAPECLLNTKN